MNRLIIFIFVLLLPFCLPAQQGKLTVQGRQYTGYLDRGRFVLLNSRGDTVLHPDADYYMNFTFRDFNHDGYKDILLEVSDNTPGRYELYLYSEKSRNFREVEDFNNFAAPEAIRGANLYYSYNKAGCADATWESYLFRIHNYRTVKLGYINGEGCGIKDGIYIYRQRGTKKILIETLPLKTIEGYKDYKWGFLKSYWTKNFRKFLLTKRKGW